MKSSARSFSLTCAQIILWTGLAALALQGLHNTSTTTFRLRFLDLEGAFAVCLVVLGCAVWICLSTHKKWAGLSAFSAVLLLSLFAATASVSTRSAVVRGGEQSWFNWTAQLLHMPPIAAACLAALSLAGLMAVEAPSNVWLYQPLALLPGALSWLVVAISAYRIPSFTPFLRYAGLNVQQAPCLLVAGLALLFLQDERGVSRFIWSNAAGGVSARHLVPVCLVGPLLLGLTLERLGVGHGDTRIALAVMGVTGALSGLILVWWSCSRLNAAEAAQQGAKRDLEDSRVTYARLLEVEVANRTRELKDSTSRERALLQSAADPICGIDVEQRVTFLNETAATLLGLPAGEALRQPITSLLRQLRPDKSVCSIEECCSSISLQEGRVVRSPQEFFLKPDGSIYAAEICVTPIRSGSNSMGNVTGAMLIFRDNHEWLELERMKDELLSIVSHEIRTPMATVRGALGLMSSGKIQPGDASYQQLMQLANSNVNRLIRLVNDLLDVERLESGKQILNKAIVSTKELVSGAVEPIRVLARLQDVQIETQVQDGLVYVDADRITQALSNLLGNALKYSKAGNHVWVRCSNLEERVEIAVQDEGKGIPAEKLHAVFDRFQQVDASDSRQKGGTGLGLTTARAIIEQHGGTIWVESQLGKGSTFRFTLPTPRYRA